MSSIRHLTESSRTNHQLSWVSFESSWDIHNWKNIEVLIVLNWSSDVRRSSLNCRFSDIQISLAQYIITFRRSHPNLTWAFRDKVQRSGLNILFQYLFPWDWILSDVLQNHRCKKDLDRDYVIRHILLWSERSLSEWYHRTWSEVVGRRVSNSIMFFIFIFIWFNDCTSGDIT